MHLVVQVGSCGDTSVTHRSNHLALLNILPLLHPKGIQVGIPCVDSMLMLYNDIIAKAGIKGNGYYLPVSGAHHRVTRTPGREVQPLVDVPLAGNGVLVLAKLHGNVPHTILQRPDAGNLREQGSLGLQHLSNLFDGLDGTLQIGNQLLDVSSFPSRSGNKVVCIQQ